MRHRMIGRGLVAALVALVALPACETDEPTETDEANVTDEESSDDESGSGEQATGLDEVIADIQAFWEEAAPEFADFEYEPLDEGAIGGIGDDLPTCDGTQLAPEDVEGNAFAAGCSEGIVVAYDDLGILADSQERFGPVGPAVVLAHEFGHVVQFQLGIEAPTVIAEQQADCLAGAWAFDAYERAVPPFETDAALDSAVGAIIEFRDEPGGSAEDEDAHGLGFDRVAAFQEGFESGVGGCASYIDDPPELTEVPFADEEEEATAGDLTFDEVVPLLEDELNRVFGEVFGLPAITVDDLETDLDAMREEHEYAGDGATAVLLAANWSAVVRGAGGFAVETADDILPLACGAGAWTGTIIEDPESEIQPSPGDLDEAIVGLADLVWEAQGEEGLLFDVIAQYRLGISDGFEACELA